MARIKIFPEQTRISPRTPVPIASSGRAALGFEGSKALAQGLSQLGQVIGRIEEEQEIKRVQTDTMRGKTAMDTLHRNAFQFASENAQPDGSDIMELYDNELQKGVPKVLTGLREEAAQRVQNYGDNARDVGLRNLYNKKLRMGEVFITQQLEGNRNQTSALIQDDPDNADKYSQRYILDAYVNLPNHFTPRAAADNKAQSENTFANDIFRGYEAKGVSNPIFYQKGLAILDASAKEPTKTDTTVQMDPSEARRLGLISEKEFESLSKTGGRVEFDSQTLEIADKDNPIVEMARKLNPQQRHHWIQKFQNKLKQQSLESVSQDLSRMKDAVTYAQGNRTESEMAEAERIVADSIQRVNESPFIKVERKMQLAAEATADMTVAQVAHNMRRSPRFSHSQQAKDAMSFIDQNIKELASRLPGVKFANDKFFMASVKESATSKIQSVQQTIKKEQEYDAAMYVRRAFPGVQRAYLAAADGDIGAMVNYKNLLKSKQEYLQIPSNKRRVLTREESSKVGLTIKAGIDAGTGSETLESIQQYYGPMFKEAISDAIQDKSIDNPGVMIAAHMGDRSSRDMVLTLYNQRENINSSFSKKFGQSSAQLKSAVREATAEMSAALHQFSDSGGMEYYAGFKDLITLETKRLKLKNPYEVDFRPLARRAYENVIENNFAVVNGFNTRALIPRSDSLGRPVHIANVEAFLNAHHTEEGLNRLNVKPFADAPNEEWFKEYLLKNGKWKINKQQTGLGLYLDGVHVKDKSGNLIEQSFDGMGTDNLSSRERMKFNQKIRTLFGRSEVERVQLDRTNVPPQEPQVLRPVPPDESIREIRQIWESIFEE